ncbi:hypothetical protein GCM10022247_34720 [Allokutzneria multivorans]|uniref:Transposase n=1 Tax=Allokutzneria multivorans TaxID=1142134 RepID=A0ABP7SBN5_9PSEU
MIVGYDYRKCAVAIRPDGSRWTMAIRDDVHSAAATLMHLVPELRALHRYEPVWIEGTFSPESQHTTGPTPLAWSPRYGHEREVSTSQLDQAAGLRRSKRSSPANNRVIVTRFFFAPEVTYDAAIRDFAIESEFHWLIAKVRQGELSIDG